MKTSTIVGIIVVILIAIGAWYWWSMSAAQPATATGPSTTAGINGSPNQGNLGQTDTGTPQQPDQTTAAPALILGLNSNAKLGQFLIGSNGMTVYTYSKDTAGVSNCTGTCATNWPPYTVAAGTQINLQAGITGTFGTAKRADGTMQLTYKGMPLYFYIKDKAAGDTTGQGVGGVWYVAKP